VDDVLPVYCAKYAANPMKLNLQNDKLMWYKMINDNDMGSERAMEHEKEGTQPKDSVEHCQESDV
jgi:hypothetical protein